MFEVLFAQLIARHGVELVQFFLSLLKPRIYLIDARFLLINSE